MDKLNLLVEVAKKVGLNLSAKNLACELVNGQNLRAYKGVSFNPYGGGQRESLLLLDFLSLLYEARSIIPEPLILDASPYWIVNQIEFQSADPSALATAQCLLQQAVEKAWSKDPSYETVRTTASLRYRYLKAISNGWANVCTALDVWTDPDFIKILVVAIEQFCKFIDGRWEVNQAVPYYRYEHYSAWFTPLVAAEQLFMLQNLNCQIFVAPVEETNWSAKAQEFIAVNGQQDFARLLYQRPSGINYSYDALPSFADSERALRAKLKSNAKLEKLIFQLVAPFIDKTPERTGVSSVLRFIKRINDQVSELDTTPFPKTDIRSLKWESQ